MKRVKMSDMLYFSFSSFDELHGVSKKPESLCKKAVAEITTQDLYAGVRSKHSAMASKK